MKFKDLIIPLFVALLSTWALQYFFFPRQQTDNRAEIATDRSFVAPTSVTVAEPLDVDINFSDAVATRPKLVTEVQLPHGVMNFSNDGAIIQFMGYKRPLGGKEGIIETVVPPLSKEVGMFLVALNGPKATPYYYDLIERKDEPTTTTLTYKGESAVAMVIKQFIVHHETYQVDVKLTVEPKDKAELRPRIFFNAPLASAQAGGAIQAVLYSDRGAIEEKSS